MEDILLKLNMIKNHNHIIRLENKNKEKDYKIKKMKKDYKGLLLEYQNETNNSFDKIKLEIKKIKDENNNLKIENEYYKKTLQKIPRFLLKLFIKKDNKLLN